MVEEKKELGIVDPGCKLGMVTLEMQPEGRWLNPAPATQMNTAAALQADEEETGETRVSRPRCFYYRVLWALL